MYLILLWQHYVIHAKCVKGFITLKNCISMEQIKVIYQNQTYSSLQLSLSLAMKRAIPCRKKVIYKSGTDGWSVIWWRSSALYTYLFPHCSTHSPKQLLLWFYYPSVATFCYSWLSLLILRFALKGNQSATRGHTSYFLPLPEYSMVYK